MGTIARACIGGVEYRGASDHGWDKASREDLLEAASRLGAVVDRGPRTRLFAELATWSSLQYIEAEIEEIRARMSISLKELMLLSPAGEELAREKIQEGMRKGKLEGPGEGLLAAARRDLLFVVNARFPGIVSPDTVQSAGFATVQALFEALILASDRASARSAVASVLGTDPSRES
ncbi:MAG: hypothetical protein R2729_22720 [Bryobacteraceae bacterium]